MAKSCDHKCDTCIREEIKTKQAELDALKSQLPVDDQLEQIKKAIDRMNKFPGIVNVPYIQYPKQFPNATWTTTCSGNSGYTWITSQSQ